MNTPSVPRNAATVVVVRDAPHGLEVLMLRRTESRDHTSGAWVFPGGLLDAADRTCHALCVGVDDAAASAQLGLPAGGLDYYVAAMRECFEEAGILFAVDRQGQPIDMLIDQGTRLVDLRGPLHRGEVGFAAICAEFGLRLAADQLHYIAHWITPKGRAKRFDTRFFLAVLPSGQSSAHDALETVDHGWLRPADALARASELRLLTPQRSLLATLARHQHSDTLLAWARGPREIVSVTPRLALDSTGVQTVQPHEPAWAEIGLLDPAGQGTAWCEMRPGVAVQLAPHVIRITGAGGWNSYVLGDARHCAVVDPGCDDAAHLDAIVRAAPGPIERILLTDAARSLGAAALAQRCGAPVQAVDDMDMVPVADALTLRVMVAEGAPAQRLFMVIEEQMLLSGEVPPEVALPAPHDAIAWIAPAHGFVRSARAHAAGA